MQRLTGEPPQTAQWFSNTSDACEKREGRLFQSLNPISLPHQRIRLPGKRAQHQRIPHLDAAPLQELVWVRMPREPQPIKEMDHLLCDATGSAPWMYLLTVLRKMPVSSSIWRIDMLWA